MSSRSRGSALRPVTVALCLGAVAFASLVAFAATAHAAYYDVVFCAGGNGSGNPVPGVRPAFFDWKADCGAPPSYPADGDSYLRLNENENGTAANNDEVSLSWYAPPYTSIVAGGGYTREPNAFNAGWRARFWAEDQGGGVHNILLQGAGIENGDGITKNTTPFFASHLWPFGGFDDYKRFVFGLWCVRPAGCDRSNFNAVDANTITLVASDKQGPQANFVDAAIIRGEWVRGYAPLSWFESDQGSGLRFSRLGVDGGTFGDGTIDYQAKGECQIGYRDGGREFGRSLVPCTRGPYQRWYGLETKGLSDGTHTLSVCLQDYSQYLHGESSCDPHTIHTDNTAPGKPASLEVTSANPARYLRHFGARWSLPPNSGSPIAKVHYQVLNGKGEVVVAEKTLAATNPTVLSSIEGPASPGAYTLRVWLSDQVGFTGPAAETPIPRDTTPPAAPQNLRVAGTTAHWVEKLDLRWQNIVDAGSPIEEAHYQVLDGSGDVLGGTHAIDGDNVEAIDGLQTPAQTCACAVRVWLTDEEGNVGAAASVPLPRDTTPPAAPQDVSVASPGASRAAEGFDVRWRDIADDGSPIDAAHYAVLNGTGKAVVPETTVSGKGIDAIANLNTPRDRGAYTLRLWLSDSEGNVGAPISVPLSYECVRSDAGGGTALSSEVVGHGQSRRVLRQGQGAVLRGRLLDPGGRGVENAPLCVFARAVSDPAPEFLGLAIAGPSGTYRYALPAGPSRELTVAYRSGQRELSASTQIATRVKPAFGVRRKVVRNKRFARFRTCIPGPHNEGVVMVLQVKRGHGWLVFRRYRTGPGGCARVVYRFNQTEHPTLYIMRAQVREQADYPYVQGTSRPLRLIVLPRRRR